MRWVALVLLLALCAGSLTSASAKEPPCIEDREAMLALEFWTFDQNPDLGWPSVQRKDGCSAEAADLIAEYHQRLREKGEPVYAKHPEVGEFEVDDDGEVSLLYWHEGQVRAGMGDYEAARELFVLNTDVEENNSRGFRHYALATIAFLDGDLETMKSERELLAALDVNGFNTAAIDSMIRCFGRPYMEAYGSAECRAVEDE
ncbi:MAG: hypothetical protein AAGI03_08105 [Pseudomonadota bacterium]